MFQRGVTDHLLRLPDVRVAAALSYVSVDAFSFVPLLWSAELVLGFRGDRL